jgi:hypothetical protein
MSSTTRAIPTLLLRARTRLHGTTVHLARFRTCSRGCSVVAARCGIDGRQLFDAAGEPDRETIHLESSADVLAFEHYVRAGGGIVRLGRAR